MSDWLDDVKKVDEKKYFEPILQKKRDILYEWHDILTDNEPLREMLQDLEDTSYMLAPSIWILQMFGAISAILQGCYRDNKGGNLNSYSLGIGGTGIGKDSGRKYYKALLKAIGLGDLFLGDTLKSNKSLEVPLTKRKENASGLALVDEMGSLLIKMSGDKCPDYLETLYGLILSAYSSNSYTLPASSTSGEVHLERLNLVIAGTSAMSKLIDGVTFATIETGLMNRFFILEEVGGRCPNPKQVKAEGQFSDNVLARFKMIKAHVDKIKNGYFRGKYGDPIQYMQVYFSREDEEYISQLERKIIAKHTLDNIACPDAYGRIIETAKRISCIYAIYKDYEKPVFCRKFFDAIISKVKEGLDVLVDIAQKNKNKNLKETSDEAKTRLFNAIVDLFKASPGLARGGAKPGLIKSRILDAPKKYGYAKENYPDAIAMSVIGKITYNVLGFRKEGEGNKTMLYYDFNEVIDEKITNEIKATFIDQKEQAIDEDKLAVYQAVQKMEHDLEKLKVAASPKKQEEPKHEEWNVLAHIERTG